MSNSLTPTFGAMMRDVRVERGLTLEAVARKTRLSVRTVSAIETGASRGSRLARLALAKVYKLSARELAALEASEGGRGD